MEESDLQRSLKVIKGVNHRSVVVNWREPDPWNLFHGTIYLEIVQDTVRRQKLEDAQGRICAKSAHPQRVVEPPAPQRHEGGRIHPFEIEDETAPRSGAVVRCLSGVGAALRRLWKCVCCV